MKILLNTVFCFFILINLHAKEICLAPKSRVNSTLSDQNLEDIVNQIVEELKLEKETHFDFHPIEISEKKVVFERFHQIKNGSDSISLVRIGEMIFVDGNIKLSEYHRNLLSNNLIFLNHLNESELGFSGLSSASASTIAAMIQTDFKDKVWFDLGAGSGILSLVAKKLGAKSLVLIEKDSFKAKQNLRHNGINENDFLIIKENLINYENMIDLIFDEFLNEEIILGSNIGSWFEYDITNITSIAFVNAVNKKCGKNAIVKVILGGYDEIKASMMDSNWRESGKKKEGFQKEREFVKKLGFNPESVFPEIGISAFSHAFSEEINLDDRLFLEKFMSPEPYEIDAELLTVLGYVTSEYLTARFNVGFQHDNSIGAISRANIYEIEGQESMFAENSVLNKQFGISS